MYNYVVNCIDYSYITTVVQAELVDPNDVNVILFPADIDPNAVSEFGSAQSILSREFLVDRGAEGCI